MTELVADQLVKLSDVYNGRVDKRELGNGTVLVTLKDVRLPVGWNKERTSVRYVIPVGYPFAAPDCFWADRDLSLANGVRPQATNVQVIPEANEDGLWFSWHVQGWNPSHGSLVMYAKMIERRLADGR